jgi:manganese/zinc/iron transport system permease protein
VELLNRTQLVREDAAIGLVFPAIFSVAVILISRFAGDVHLDTDAVLLGELVFAPFNRLKLFGLDIGPEALYTTGGILLLNLIFVIVFYKELKLATFDPALAAALGFMPTLIHYALMTLVSLTAVGSFDAVGSVLVVAFMIAPPAAAYLLTDRLSRMLIYSALIGIFSAVSGYWLSYLLDASIAGSMATMTGASFLISYLFAPERGLLAQARRRQNQRIEFALTMLTMHIANHTAAQEAEIENEVIHLNEHLKWTPQFAMEVVGIAERTGLGATERRVAHPHRKRIETGKQEFRTGPSRVRSSRNACSRQVQRRTAPTCNPGISWWSATRERRSKSASQPKKRSGNSITAALRRNGWRRLRPSARTSINRSSKPLPI